MHWILTFCVPRASARVSGAPVRAGHGAPIMPQRREVATRIAPPVRCPYAFGSTARSTTAPTSSSRNATTATTTAAAMALG